MFPFLPPGALPPPPQGFVPGGYVPGRGIPPGIIPPGAIPPGAIPSGIFPPGVLPAGAVAAVASGAAAAWNASAGAAAFTRGRAPAVQSGVLLGPQPRDARREGSNEAPHGPLPTLPILLVPGFLSTRLVAARSTVNPAWQGKLIWLSLSKLGFQAFHAKGLFDDSSYDSLKNKWLQHMMLKNAEEETDGVHLEAVPGVEGVRCLDPESLFGLAAEGSTIFGGVCTLLENYNYVAGRDFDAASYDWRFAPDVLTRRDQFFERMCEQVERLNTRGRGVVLFGHSMGNKTVRYFLEYAKVQKGQRWLDANVHSWVSAGGPLLGAPQAVRSTVQGMSEVRPLFSLSEAIVFARCLSSSPWLFPTGPPYKEPYHFVRRQGMLEVICVAANVPGCGLDSARNKVMMNIDIDWGATTDSLLTKSAESFDGTTAIFGQANNMMIFGGPPDLPPDASILVTVREKGIHDDVDGNNYIKRLGKNLVAGVQAVSEAVTGGQKTFGRPRASTDAAPLCKVFELGDLDEDGFYTMQMPFNVPGQQDNYVTLRVRWTDYRTLRAALLGSLPMTKPGQSMSVPVCHSKSREIAYDAMDIKSMLQMECPEVLDTWERYYECDPLATFEGTNDCPPIRRMVAVHGVDIKTEIMYALKLNTIRVRTGEVYMRFVLDTEAQLVAPRPGLSMSGGMVYEEPGGPTPSGDGVVPIASMEHCRDWAQELDLKVERIPGVLHAPMLANKRFQDVLIEALTEDRTPAGQGRALMRAALGFGNPMPGKNRIWQAAKDDSGQLWWDFPGPASQQLSAAYVAGQPNVQVSMSGSVYSVDLHTMTQRNLKTGMVRAIRVIESP